MPLWEASPLGDPGLENPSPRGLASHNSGAPHAPVGGEPPRRPGAGNPSPRGL